MPPAKTSAETALPATSAGEQIAAALSYLATHARTDLERVVLRSAYLVCEPMPALDFELCAKTSKQSGTAWPRLDARNPLPALQFLQNEAKRNQLEVAEVVLMSTISLWMIATDIEMVRRRQDRKE